MHHRRDFFCGTVFDGGGVDFVGDGGHWFFFGGAMSLVLPGRNDPGA
jgi:hypothetical protein